MLRRTIIRPALQVLGIYETALARRPFSTQLAVGSLLVVLGDSIAQHVIERKPMEKHDWQRTGNMVVLRGLFHSSVIILWYRFLQKKVPMTDYSKNVRLCAHLGLDQGLFGPANVTFFFLASGVLEGRTNEQIRQKLRDRLWETIVSGWIVWIPFSFIGFRFIHIDYRLVAGQFVAIFWNSFMSYQNARHVRDRHPAALANKQSTKDKCEP